MLRQWRKRNPELVRAQKQRYYERKVWPRVPRTRQGKRKDCKEYDPDEILRDLFGVRVVLTDFKKSVAPPPPPSLPPSSLVIVTTCRSWDLKKLEDYRVKDSLLIRW